VGGTSSPPGPLSMTSPPGPLSMNGVGGTSSPPGPLSMTSPPGPLSMNGEGGTKVTGGARVSAEKAQLARSLRARSTAAEEEAWELLRDRRLAGLKFRRQQPIAGFIVDFFCAERSLVLEVDGGVHDEQRDADQERTAILEGRGLRVLRIRNEDLTPENVRRLIEETSPPGPLSMNGEGGTTSPSSGTPSPFMERGLGGEVSASKREYGEDARRELFAALETFLDQHTQSDELGLRLHGEQLATGVRFVRMLKEGTYDVVVGNPPYQGTAKMKDASYVARHYPKGKADLYAAFLERGLQLVREGGTSSMVTMRNWMFIKQYAEFRQWLLASCDLRALGDVSWGAFEDMRDNPVALSIVRRASPTAPVVAIDPGNAQERIRTAEELDRKRAGMLAGVGRHDFEAAALRVVPEWPLVYWWGGHTLDKYLNSNLIGTKTPCKVGIVTGNNVRFTRSHTETNKDNRWKPFVNGAKGASWFDPCDDRVEWKMNGLETKVLSEFVYGSHTRQVRNENLYFTIGIACAAIGNNFSARVHRKPAIIGSSAASIFCPSPFALTCSLNSSKTKEIIQSLNPGIHFEVGDINRLPDEKDTRSGAIETTLSGAFTTHEAHREPSVEFRAPGPSPWRHAQDWAQLAVDRPEGAPLPEYVEVLDPEPDTDHVSFALGVALGRFGKNGEGILDPTSPPNPLSMNGEGASGEEGSGSPSPFMERGRGGEVLPAGLCFLDGTLDAGDLRDSLGHDACALLRTTWAERGAAIDDGNDLRTWLRTSFFADVHKGMYENRPIHWPLSSKSKTFVAWVNIHRMNEGTLRVLLADHLEPVRKRLDGELVDLRTARDGADKKAAKAAEKRFAQVQKARDELIEFIALVEQCAERGAPPTDAKCRPRDADARYAPDLDDGVMINSAALWPLLEPQWKDPKKWWKELCNAEGKKDYDWSHLAMRYWPARVDAKCKADPSLGVAHGCFWRYHPARAWAWELRLQDEIGPDFRIEEKPYRGAPLPTGQVTDDDGDAPHRARWLREHPQEALDAVEKEVLRRLRKQKKPQTELRLLDTGLWSALPAACWALELRVSEKQGAELRLLTPDEEAARAAYARANPEAVVQRQQLLAQLQPLTLALGEDADEAAAGDEGDDAAEDEEAPE
jgi:very-short-patch-repair endonuclease